MIPATQTFINAVEQPSRTFRARLKDNTGTVIDCAFTSLSITTGGCGETVKPAAMFSSMMQASVQNLTRDLYAQELTLEIGVVTGTDAQTGEPTVEYIQNGKYTVTETAVAKPVTTFTAVGRLASKCGYVYESNLTYPASLQSVINEIQTTLRQTTPSITIKSKGFTIAGTLETKIEGATIADALINIAALLGAFVTEDYNGDIVISSFGAGDTYAVGYDRFKIRPTYTENPFTVTGIACRVSNDYEDEETGEKHQGIVYTYGDPNVTITNAYMTQALFNTMAPRFTGYSFYPATAQLALGNPRLEPWDVLSVTDTDGTVRRVPCHTITHGFDGGYWQTITSLMNGENDGSDEQIKGQTMKEIEKLSADIFIANQAILQRATITQLNAAIASIDTGYIQKAIIGNATITDFTATKGEINQLLVNDFTAEQIATILLDFDAAVGASLKLDDLQSKRGAFERLLADDFTASEIESISAVFATAATTSLVTESLTAQYAQIDFANIGVENVAELFVNVGLIENATITEGRITGTLAGVRVVADIIEANQISAGKLLVQSSDDGSTYYEINLSESGITADEVPASAMSQYLSGTDIVAHTITTREITAENLRGTGGWINLSEGTFRYSNAELGTGVAWDGQTFRILSGEGTGTLPVVAGYIDPQATAFGSGWLTDAEGQTLTPAADTVYIVQSEGAYYGMYYLWSTAETQYQTFDVFGEGASSSDIINTIDTANQTANKTSSMTYEDGVLTLGGYGGFKITIGNTVNNIPRLSFWQGDNEVAYINNNEMYINKTIVISAMSVGDWQWKKQEDTGNLTLQWIGA